MSIRAISSAVNASFVRSFQGLAGGDGPKIGAGAGEGASIYSGLRLGARTFATSIQNLNSAIGIVNVADSTLKKLSTVVDDMIGLAEKATSVSAGAESRRKLQADFDKLVDQFRDIVGDSEFSGIEYLTEEGLSLLFQRVGLDRENSDGVAAVLAQFVKPDSEDSFASEETKGPRPPDVPVLRKSKATQQTNLALDALSQSAITPEFSVYSENNGSGYSQPYYVSESGQVTGQAGVTSNQTVLAVNESKGNSGESTGYTLIKSTQDLTSDNPSGYEQIFLVDPNGTVVRQVSDIDGTGDTLTNTIADISADNKTVVSNYNFNNSGVYHIAVGYVTNINDDPLTTTYIDDIVADADTVRLSNNAQYFAYKDGGNLAIREVGGTTDNYLIGLHNVQDFGFADSDTIIFSNSLGEVYSYNFNSSSENLILVNPDITKLTVLESDSTFSANDGSAAGIPHISAIAFTTNDGNSNELTVLNYDLNTANIKTRYRRDLGAGTVDAISLSYQNDNNLSKDRVDVGIKGYLPSLFGDQDTELYRIKESKFATNSSLFSQASSDPSKILDGNLLTRADSYRLLGDLKALKSQISDNLDALSDARDYIANNVELVRTAGFAFLKISDQLKGSEDAETVARLLAAEIRRNATQAQAAQAENLNSIVSQTTALLDSAT